MSRDEPVWLCDAEGEADDDDDVAPVDRLAPDVDWPVELWA